MQGEEVVNLQFKKNEETADPDDHYSAIYFAQLKTKVDTESSRIMGLGVKAMIRNFVTFLAKEKVLNADGTVNAEKVEAFRDKYGR